jgi:hypothetical protein
MSIPKDGIITPKMMKKDDKPRVLVAANKGSAAKAAATKTKKA